MATTVGFRGFPLLRPGSTYPVKPFGIALAPGDEILFTGDVANDYNRLCGDTPETRRQCHDEHDGDCWARLFTAAENAAFPRMSPEPFFIVGESTPPPANSDDPPPPFLAALPEAGTDEPPPDESTMNAPASAGEGESL